MKILVNTGPAHPLYFPVVGLAWALRAAGHEVLVAAPENWDAVVRGSGLPMAAVSGSIEMRDVMGKDRAGNPLKFPESHDQMGGMTGAGFARLAEKTLDGTVDLVASWKPDLVVAESYSFATAAIAAKVNGVPWVKHTVGPGDLPIVSALNAELAPELARFGLDRLPEADLVIDNTPPLLGDSIAGAQPMRYVPYGEPGLLPEWVLRPRTKPRLLVTLGSVQPQAGGLPVLVQLLKALGTLEAELVVAVADFLVPQMGQLPDSVVAAGWQSLTSVLSGCDAVVHHGGPGTMMTCLTHGLPQVVIPGMGKPLSAIGRLAEFGAIRRIEPRDLTPELLLESTGALLADESYGERAREVRDQIAQLPSPADLVPVLEKLVAK
ncbi:nucleotide disphospho-sugar-binding domain-containing protein [Crossiella cryophila]|uniref:UDP:flavonoid glycosyltransferase YjiC (YdhE family) n=1 Tax=Crossiella cryophila TaxID=43355 RepID=A0A7W7C7T4_9PSEU|nr:nucleotide disphospho-sugar-binding domain-containing protein [Crossiella cryophila]MBB4676120.1 UDP:flavonoid glycosyltransferase YjiC (YdhE family) [Crossiella cryophila]